MIVDATTAELDQARAYVAGIGFSTESNLPDDDLLTLTIYRYCTATQAMPSDDDRPLGRWVEEEPDDVNQGLRDRAAEATNDSHNNARWLE